MKQNHFNNKNLFDPDYSIPAFSRQGSFDDFLQQTPKQAPLSFDFAKIDFLHIGLSPSDFFLEENSLETKKSDELPLEEFLSLEQNPLCPH